MQQLFCVENDDVLYLRTLFLTKIFSNDKGIAKIEVSIAKGKKLYDKRNTIKDRESKINLKRRLKS